MSGQPYRTLSDIADFRQDYLNSLMAQVQLNDANLKANQVYISTGQLPARSAMPDTRTTTEKLADVARLRVNLINDMRPISDASTSAQFVQAIEKSPLNSNGALFTFLAQNVSEIVSGIKKKYKYGIKGDSDDVQKFTNFVESAYNTSKGITGSIKSSFNRPQSNKASSVVDIQNIKIELTKISNILQSYYHYPNVKSLIGHIQNQIKKFNELCPSLEAMDQLRNTFSQNTVILQQDTAIAQLVSDIYRDIDIFLRDKIPNVNSIWTILDSLNKEYTDVRMHGGVMRPPDQTTINSLNAISSLIPEERLMEQYNRQILAVFQHFIDIENEQIRIRAQAEQDAQELYEQGDIGLENEPAAVLADEVVSTIKTFGLATIVAGLLVLVASATGAANAVGEYGLSTANFAGNEFNGQMAQFGSNSYFNPSGQYIENGLSVKGFDPLNPYAVNGLDFGGNVELPPSHVFQYMWNDGTFHSTPEGGGPAQAPIRNIPTRDNPRPILDEFPPDDSPDLIPDELSEDIVKIFTDDEILRELLKNPSLTPAKRREAHNERELLREKFKRDYPDFNWDSTKQMAIDEGHQVAPIGHGLKKKGRGRPKGSGIARPFKEKVDLSRGIEPDRRFVKFGRFLINTNKLHDDIVAIKRPSGSNITEFPSQRVSTHLSNVFKKIIGGGVPSFNELSSLNDMERNYLYSVSKKAEIADKLSIPTPSKDQKDKDIHDYEVAKGEILSGNDNREFIKKFKLMVVKLCKSGVLPKKEANEVLSDLVELGF